ncbi:hypothetical protein Tco_1480744 [Tanacetum coccineum]
MDLYDRCYARQTVVDNAVNRRSRELLQVIEKLKGECDIMRSRERARDKECEGLRVKCEAAMTDFKKNHAVLALLKKIYALSIEAKEHKLLLLRLKRQGWRPLKCLSGKRLRSLNRIGDKWAFEQVVGMKEPFNLSKVKGYRSSYKKDHTEASNDLSTATFPWTQVPLVSSQRATSSSVLAFNLMAPLVDASVIKHQSSPHQ